jgi:hypothetical protein
VRNPAGPPAFPLHGYVPLSELAGLFAVEPATIRRRLRAEGLSPYAHPLGPEAAAGPGGRHPGHLRDQLGTATDASHQGAWRLRGTPLRYRYARGRDGQTFADPMRVTARWPRVEDVDAVRVIWYRLVAVAMDAGPAHHATSAEPS